MKSKLSLLLLAALSANAGSQENMSYQKPPQSILELADFQRAPVVSMDSHRKTLLLSYRNTYKSLNDLNQTEMRLAGLRINPVTNISSTLTYVNNLKLRKVDATDEVQVKGLPENPLISYVTWSPSEKKIAFTNTAAKGVELWVIDVETATAKKLTEANLNANLGTPFDWYRDSESLLIKVLPKSRPALLDASKDLPSGPIISTSSGATSQNRTYADLLKNQNDESNFVNLTTSELHKLSLNGKSSLFKKAEMFDEVSFSPDGKYLQISSIQKPFSYIVPLQRFPSKTIVSDVTGKQIKVVDESPLNEIIPKGFSAVPVGKRYMAWRADKPASLTYAQALDGGDPANKAEFRDEVFSWDAPFDKPAISLVKVAQRYGGIVWGNDNLAVVTDGWYDTRNTKAYLFNPSNPAEAPRVISDRNMQDIYSDPGRFETKYNQYHRRVLAIEDNKAYLLGAGHTRKGQFPFIDELDLGSLKKNRLYQSTYTDKIESIVSIEDVKKGDVLVQIQSKTEYPNYYFRNIKGGNQLTPVTQFKNPFTGLKDVSKEVIKYKRKDGVELSGTLYLPAAYDKEKKEKLPLLIWAYPAEFKDKDSAGQSRHNETSLPSPAMVHSFIG
ncbi:hypothetical protein ACO0LD_10270 [Undibacterium sp. Ji83W]|uniref:hypothetical protein n=1 Tax=Undibacterium sp. Ji83W TaxID=3413043 RepID=UPI003BF3EAE5